MGRVFMTAIDDPFCRRPREIEAVARAGAIVLVDFHAEATSEKIAMGWHLDGTRHRGGRQHTHVQTADERVLPGGTAYITDVGMTGPHDRRDRRRARAGARPLPPGCRRGSRPAKGMPKLHGVS